MNSKYKSQKGNQNKKSTTPYSPRKQCLKKKLKTLQEKLRRRNKKMQSLKDIASVLKDKNFLPDKYANNIENQFSGLNKMFYIIPSISRLAEDTQVRCNETVYFNIQL